MLLLRRRGGILSLEKRCAGARSLRNAKQTAKVDKDTSKYVVIAYSVCLTQHDRVFCGTDFSVPQKVRYCREISRFGHSFFWHQMVAEHVYLRPPETLPELATKPGNAPKYPVATGCKTGPNIRRRNWYPFGVSRKNLYSAEPFVTMTGYLISFRQSWL